MVSGMLVSVTNNVDLPRVDAKKGAVHTIKEEGPDVRARQPGVVLAVTGGDVFLQSVKLLHGFGSVKVLMGIWGGESRFRRVELGLVPDVGNVVQVAVTFSTKRLWGP